VKSTYYHGSCRFEGSCWFNFARMCIIVFIYASADSWDSLRQKKYRCHPVYNGNRDRNESTNVSISSLIIGTKPKRFDLVRLLSE
jgi:hypothetical protein